MQELIRIIGTLAGIVVGCLVAMVVLCFALGALSLAWNGLRSLIRRGLHGPRTRDRGHYDGEDH